MASSDEALARNLQAVLRRVHAGDFNQCPIEEKLLCELHRTIFADVYDHAGRARGPATGSPRLEFLGDLSAPERGEVPKRLREAFNRHRKDLAESDGSAGAAFSLAVRLHADLIGIQPFENGNKRTARVLFMVLLVKSKIEPFPLDGPAQEYFRCLLAYFKGGNQQPLVDWFLGLAASEEGSPKG